ncbi:MAG: FAD-dependent oxidoreductase, partial [Verrucomicrobiota bacterium]
MNPRLLLACACLISLLPFQSLRAAEPVDVLVYGATPGGIAAALGAADAGRSVLLVEPTAQLGGLTTSGLSHTDFHSRESLSGAFLDFARRVEAHYVATYGADSPQARACFHGTFGEPKVNRAIFVQMLAERLRITVQLKSTLQRVEVVKPDGRPRINAVDLRASDGTVSTVRAAVFIDGTYEGDLMAAAGVAWRDGRHAVSRLAGHDEAEMVRLQ